MDKLPDPTVAVPQTASMLAIIATVVGWLPAIVAIVPAVYYAVLIFESKTVQGWLRRRRAKKRLKRLKSKRPMATRGGC